MKLTKTLAIAFVVLGELLLLAGIMICYLQWPNIFQGLSAGPLLILVGLAFEVPGLIKLDSMIGHKSF